MPVYTKTQTCAMATLRKLRCIRHDQMHWLLGLEHPGAKVSPHTEMRRLSYLGKAVNDEKYYYWPGCGLDPELIIALDIMRRASGDEQPVFNMQTPPCKLAFSVVRNESHLACGIFFPKPDKEWQTVAVIEQLPSNRMAAIYLENLGHISRFTINRPHIFVSKTADGGYEYTSGHGEGGD